VKISDERIPPSSFTSLLEWIYLGKTTIDESFAFGLLDLARMFNFPQLVLECEKILESRVTIKNCLAFMIASTVWSSEEIFSESCRVFSSSTNVAMSQSEELLCHVPFKLMMRIVQLDRLAIKEIELFQKVLHWYKLNPTKQHLEVFNHIRYDLISPKDMVNCVGPSKVVSSQLYLSSLEYHCACEEKKKESRDWETSEIVTKANKEYGCCHFSEALKLYESVIAHPLANDEERGWSLFRCGAIHCRYGQLKKNEELSAKLFKECLPLLEKASEKGDVRAFCALGWLNSSGRGVPLNKTEAVRLWSIAADEGCPIAQYYLACMYQQGSGVPEKDMKEALRLFTLSADQGYSLAQTNLGLMYDRGEGVPMEKEFQLTSQKH